MNQNVYREYLAILREEIVPALGCTEPIAIAYAAAKARSVLGRLPEHIDVRCSGNIIKNVKAVIVPTTGNMKGIETSAVLGAVGGNPDKKLEVLTDVSPKDLELTWELLRKKICSVSLLEGVSNLQIIVEMTAGQESALVEIAFSHTNIVRITVNGETVTSAPCDMTIMDWATGTVAYQGETYEGIVDGAFEESTFRSAPYFTLRIDGIVEDAQ